MLFIKSLATGTDVRQNGHESRKRRQAPAHEIFSPPWTGQDSFGQPVSETGCEGRTRESSQAPKREKHGERRQEEEPKHADGQSSSQAEQSSGSHEQSGSSKEQEVGYRNHPVGLRIQLEWTHG